MEIKASQVKELRELSGVGMMECKKALVEAEGDIDKALDLLRSNSALKAEKKSARVAADGVVKLYISESYATMVEINSETDFAAKDNSFIEFTQDIEARLADKKYLDVEDLKNDVEEDRQKLVQSIGENIQVRRLVTQEFETSKNIGTYLHSDNKLAAMVLLKEENEDLGKDIAMHISALAPISINQDGVDKDVLDREKKLIEEISSSEILEMIENGIITEGMIPKINTCLDAVNNGVTAVGIIDGREKHSILFEIFSDKGSGTLIRKWKN